MPLGWRTKYDKYSNFKNTFSKMAKKGRTLQGGTLSFLKEYKMALEDPKGNDGLLEKIKVKKDELQKKKVLKLKRFRKRFNVYRRRVR